MTYYQVEFRTGAAVQREAKKFRTEEKAERHAKKVLGIADGWLSADGSVIYRAFDLKVGLFRDTDAMKQRLLALHEDRGLLQRLKDATKDTGQATSLDAYQDRLLRALAGTDVAATTE